MPSGAADPSEYRGRLTLDGLDGGRRRVTGRQHRVEQDHKFASGRWQLDESTTGSSVSSFPVEPDESDAPHPGSARGRCRACRRRRGGWGKRQHFFPEAGRSSIVERCADLATGLVENGTPLERTGAQRISGKKLVVCPILRAGVGMLDSVLSLIPGARVGFIGLYRNEETLEPVEYYVKLPDDLPERDVILLDPMLATGNSTAAAVETVERPGAASIRLIALIAAPEGIVRIHRDHPDISIVVASIDRALNEKATSCRASATQATACTARNRS